MGSSGCAMHKGYNGQRGPRQQTRGLYSLSIMQKY